MFKVMKRTTMLTMMLVLMVLTGQAQVKTGLDLCLRDESTGEWLIALFDEFAVDDCEYWVYAKADTVKGDFVLGVIGGMSVGTVALLFVVPSFFIVFQKLHEKFQGVKN